MSRQTDRPRPVPPRPESSGPFLVVKKGSKMCRRSAGAIPTPVSATLSSASRGRRVLGDAEPDRPPFGHRLAGVDHQVQEHLLDLRGLTRVGAALGLEVDRYAVMEADWKKATDPVPLIPTRTSLHARPGAKMAREERWR